MTGDLLIANAYDPVTKEPTGWLDCYDEWGVSFEDGALEALMTFRPNKDPITNNNVTAVGTHYVTGAGLVDERTINIPVHLVALDTADYLLKRKGFYEAIRKGLLTFRITNPVEVTYQFYYVSCTQYQHHINGMAKFMLSVLETNGDGDDDMALPEPMPIHKDMEEYLYDLLELYGSLATEEQVRSIIRNYNKG